MIREVHLANLRWPIGFTCWVSIRAYMGFVFRSCLTLLRIRPSINVSYFLVEPSEWFGRMRWPFACQTLVTDAPLLKRPHRAIWCWPYTAQDRRFRSYRCLLLGWWGQRLSYSPRRCPPYPQVKKVARVLYVPVKYAVGPVCRTFACWIGAPLRGSRSATATGFLLFGPLSERYQT